MRRAPWVLAGTGAGLVAVLGYHTAALSPTGAARPVASGAPTTPPGGSSGDNSGAGGSSTTTSTAPGAGAALGPTTSTTAPTTRRADGEDVSYRYGDLQVEVTAKAKRITDVETVVDQSFDPRSQQINDQAVPILRQQALSAQSANIDGVSGATYTSLAYQQSLQAALDSLHLA